MTMYLHSQAKSGYYLKKCHLPVKKQVIGSQAGFGTSEHQAELWSRLFGQVIPVRP
jgi:hypothetical protein